MSLAFRFVSITLGILSLASCALNPVDRGVNFFEQGEYDKAAYQWNGPAKAGDPLAQYNLGLLWEGGLGSTPKNLNEAANWYIKAAKQGFPQAMYRLAHVQESLGYNEAALSWLRMAARWNHWDSRQALKRGGYTLPEPDLYRAQQARLAEEQRRQEEISAGEAMVLNALIGAAFGVNTSNNNAQIVAADALHEQRMSNANEHYQKAKTQSQQRLNKAKKQYSNTNGGYDYRYINPTYDSPDNRLKSATQDTSTSSYRSNTPNRNIFEKRTLTRSFQSDIRTVASGQPGTECSSDYSCLGDQICVKKPRSTLGVCAKAVNELGGDVTIRKRFNSTERGEKQCDFDADCGIGFECDNELKVCVAYPVLGGN